MGKPKKQTELCHHNRNRRAAWSFGSKSRHRGNVRFGAKRTYTNTPTPAQAPATDDRSLTRLIEQLRQGLRSDLLYYTASFAALTGRALTIFRAGLALNIIDSPVNGFVPWRALVAGFLITTNFANPGTRKTPFFLSSLYPTVASVSKTPFTSFFATSL